MLYGNTGLHLMRKFINQCGVLSVAALCAALLGGCGTQAKLMPVAQPQPQLLRWQVNEIAQSGVSGTPTMVVAVPDGKDWRWLWTDALGMPLARKMLHDGKWQKDGLLPTNKAALPLFNALAALALDANARQRVFPSLKIMPVAEGDQEVTLAIVQPKKGARPDVYPQFSYACLPTEQAALQHIKHDVVDLPQCSNDDAMLRIHRTQARYQIRILD